MFSVTRRLFSYVTKKQKISLVALQFLILFTSIIEIIGIGGIGPLTAMVINENLIFENQYLFSIYNYFNFESAKSFIFYFGATFCVAYLFMNLALSLTVYFSAVISNNIEKDFAISLYNQYLNQEYLKTIGRNTSEMTKNVINELNRVSQSILIPILEINARVPSIIGLCLLLSFAIDPRLYYIVGLTAILYIIIYFFVRSYLLTADKNISKSVNTEIKIINESINNIREIKLLNNNSIFVKNFSTAATQQANAKSTGLILARLPRYFIEFLIFMLGACFLMYMSFTNSNFDSILPTLALTVGAFYKLMPSINSCYHQYSYLKFNIQAFSKVEEDIKLNLTHNVQLRRDDFINGDFKNNSIFQNGEIKFENVCFSYPSSQVHYSNLNFTIPLNKITCIIGKSGSGKSTILDLLTGLIDNSAGKVLINDIDIKTNLPKWQKNISYVPQNSILIDDTILNNITFFNNKERLELEKIDNIIKLLRIDDFTDKMTNKLNSSIGEKGQRLSGGQRQRIALARALYKEPKILILDEATNAIDEITERQILRNIIDNFRDITLILSTHKKSTLEIANNIILISNEKISHYSNYSDLTNSDNYKNIFDN